MSWGFFLYAIWFNPGQNYVLYAILQGVPRLALTQEALQSIAEAVGYCGLMLFALRFPADETKGFRRSIERALPVLAVLLVGMRWWSFLSVFGFRTEQITLATYGVGVAINFVVLAILLSRGYIVRSNEGQHKTRWVFWGCLVGLSAFVFAEINASTQFWNWMWSPSEKELGAIYLVSAAVPISVLYAILRHHVVNVSFTLSRELTKPLLWLVTGGFVVYVHGKAEAINNEFWNGIHNEPVLVEFFVVALAIVILVLLKGAIDLLHDGLVHYIDRYCFKRLLEALDQLVTCGSNLETAPDDDAIDRSLVDDPVTAFNLSSAALFRRVDGNGPFKRMPAAHGWGTAHLIELVPEHPLIRRLPPRDKAAPVAVKPSDDTKQMMPKDLAFPSAAVPLFRGKELTGVVLYGPHTTDNGLNKDELKGLNNFAHTAAEAYRRVELERLQRQVKALQEENEKIKATIIITAPDPNATSPFIAPSSPSSRSG